MTDNLIAELRAKVSHPILVTALRSDFSREYPEKTLENLNDFLLFLVQGFIGAINLETLTLQVTDIISTCEKSPKSFEDIKVVDLEANSKELAGVIQKIYDNVNKIQLIKETCMEYSIILTKAKNYLVSLNTAIVQFMRNPAVCSNFKWVHQSERDRFAEHYTTDISAVIDVLKSDITELDSWVEIFKSRLNNLMRMDSAIRMLIRSNESELPSNHSQSARKTTGFNIEEL